ncbi:hypothetical protein ACFWY6_25105 [Streptomyces sp. NPDC059037]|uniref:hypothetical protein n=1 Tax=Streptomyces sp. NPDC059037 TaxID=3346710 RepID=UPI0036CDB3C3
MIDQLWIQPPLAFARVGQQCGRRRLLARLLAESGLDRLLRRPPHTVAAIPAAPGACPAAAGAPAYALCAHFTARLDAPTPLLRRQTAARDAQES